MYMCQATVVFQNKNLKMSPCNSSVLADWETRTHFAVPGVANQSAPLRLSLLIYTFPLWNVVNKNTDPHKQSSFALRWYNLGDLDISEVIASGWHSFHLLVSSTSRSNHRDLRETLAETSRLLAGPGGDGPKANRRASPTGHSQSALCFLVSYRLRRLLTLESHEKVCESMNTACMLKHSHECWISLGYELY